MSLLRRALQHLPPMPSPPFMRVVGIVGGSGVAAWCLTALSAHNWISRGASEGPSMYPTIPSRLTYNISSHRYKHGKNIQIGDIIVFKSPMFPTRESCKRVIGMPGDYVLRDPDASPTVGGAAIAGIDKEGLDSVREEPVMVQVPEGHVWVAGDNLAYSRDSRFHGPVPMALILGKTLYSGNGWFTWTPFRNPQLQPATVVGEISPEAL